LASPEILIDCIHHILTRPTPPELESLIENFRNHAPALRTGIFLLNFVGRCYFKYIVKYTVDQFKLLVLDQPINFYDTITRRLGHSETMISLAPDSMAEAVQHMRAARQLSQSSPLLTFVEQLNMNRLYRHENQLYYLTTDGRKFNLTKHLVERDPVVTLFRPWQDP